MVAAVVVEGLVKSYGEHVAVCDVSFEIAVGEVVAILGPNGAGKTTTLEILEGYRDRDEGRVEVLGRDPAERRGGLRSQIGIVLQECEDEPHLTVRETIDQFRAYYPNPRMTDDVLELVDLADTHRARVRTLSGGQRRRLDLAIALVGTPELVFLDEPTTGFDPAARRGAWEVMRRLCNLGTTIVLTTHYLDEAEALADRLLVLASGRIAAEGPPETIGGRNHTTRISFNHTSAVTGCPLSVEITNGRCSIDVAEPVSAIRALTSWAADHDIALTDLTVGRPSLEEVYLELIA
jgi:ABC-2 type transport system ATP-binding protein